MKHQNLFPVETRDAVLPGHYDRLQEWIERLPQQFSNPFVPPPKATLLCGIPGVGKGTTARCIAAALRWPLFLLDGTMPLTTLNSLTGKPFVLWVDRPGAEHAAILRWLQEAEPAKVFVVVTTDAPHKVPPELTRVDVVDTIWHLDLPTLRQRNVLWGEVLSARITGHHTHDSVMLGQLSAMFTPAEINTAYDRAARSCGGPPKEGALIDAVLAMKPLALRMDEQLACLRAWARVYASGASSDGRPRERS